MPSLKFSKHNIITVKIITTTSSAVGTEQLEEIVSFNSLVVFDHESLKSVATLRLRSGHLV